MIKVLLVDFDGVMSNDRFYAGYSDGYEREFEHLQNIIFNGTENALLDRWMRGQIDFRALHKCIAKDINADPSVYDTALIESVVRMKLNKRMLETLCKVRETGVKAVLFTNNMDVFDDFSVRRHRLADHFDAIYSSSRHGKLKTEDDSLLIKICEELSIKPKDIALVDDSNASIESVKKFGGKAFLYKEYTDSHSEFEAWLSYIMT